MRWKSWYPNSSACFAYASFSLLTSFYSGRVCCIFPPTILYFKITSNSLFIIYLSYVLWFLINDGFVYRGILEFYSYISSYKSLASRNKCFNLVCVYLAPQQNDPVPWLEHHFDRRKTNLAIQTSSVSPIALTIHCLNNCSCNQPYFKARTPALPTLARSPRGVY